MNDAELTELIKWNANRDIERECYVSHLMAERRKPFLERSQYAQLMDAGIYDHESVESMEAYVDENGKPHVVVKLKSE